MTGSISNSSRRIDVIARFQYGNQLVQQFNYENGRNEDGSYTKPLQAQSKLFENFDKTSGFSKKDFNLLKIAPFFSSFFRNIINLFVAVYLFVMVFIFGALSFFRQMIFVKKNLRDYKKREIKMSYFGQVHLTASAITTPVFFLVNILFLEHIELFLWSLLGLVVRFIVLLVKLFIQCFEIMLLPILGAGFLIFQFVRIVFKIIQAVLGPIFKRVSVDFPGK